MRALSPLTGLPGNIHIQHGSNSSWPRTGRSLPARCHLDRGHLDGQPHFQHFGEAVSVATEMKAVGARAGGVCEHLERMISFRYHLITIVAIFLAIALGTVMGAAFVQDPLLDQLRATTERLSRERDDLRTQLDRAEERAQTNQEFAQEAYLRLAAGELEGVSVVVLTQEGTSTADLDDARAAINAAGGVIEAVLTVSPRLRAGDDEDRAALAEALDLPASTEARELLAAAAEAIGLRLADGPGSDPTVLVRLIEEGFIAARQVLPADLPAVGGPGTLVVAVAGGSGGPSIEVEDFMVPALRTYASRGRSAVAVQASDSEYPFVALVRADDDLAASVSTVDDVELPAGRLALVLAGADLVRARVVGHYGLETGELLPPGEP